MVGRPFVGWPEGPRRISNTRVFGLPVAGRPMLVLLGGADGHEVQVFDAATGDSLSGFGVGHWLHQGGSVRPCVVRDGERPILVTALDDQAIRQFELPYGAVYRPEFALASEGGVRRPATVEVLDITSRFAQDSLILMIAVQDGTVRQLEAATGGEVAAPLRHDAPVLAVAGYAVGGVQQLAAGDAQGRLWRWNIETASPIGQPRLAHRIGLTGIVSYEIDGQICLATSGTDGAMRRWDAVSGEPIGEPIYHDDAVAGLCVVEVDSRPQLVVGWDVTVARYDAGTGEPAGPPWRWPDELSVLDVCSLEVAGRPTVFAAADDGVYRFDARAGRPWPASDAR